MDRQTDGKKDSHGFEILIWKHVGTQKITSQSSKLDVDPRRDDDASPMSSYGYMLRPTCMFMDRMIAPIIVHSISIQNSISNFFGKIKFLGFRGVVLVKTFPLMYQLLI